MPNLELTHPLYLDVQMMYSFLAFLDGGFSLTDEQTSTTSNSKEKGGHANAGIKLPSLLHLLGAEAGFDASLANKLENTLEYKAERHRTEAGLFNYLYAKLRAGENIVDISDATDLAGAKTGQLIEVSGKYKGNPLAAILGLVQQFFSYFDQSDDTSEPATKSGRSGQRSGNPAIRNAARSALVQPSGFANDSELDLAMKMFKHMNRELEDSPVQDVLVTTFDDLKVVLTVAAEYFTGSTREFLREGDVRVIGKLTRSLAEGDQINLSRRTLMGVAANDLVQQSIASFSASPSIKFDTADPIVTGPAAQILPMAVFV